MQVESLVEIAAKLANLAHLEGFVDLEEDGVLSGVGLVVEGEGEGLESIKSTISVCPPVKAQREELESVLYLTVNSKTIAIVKLTIFFKANGIFMITVQLPTTLQ